MIKIRYLGPLVASGFGHINLQNALNQELIVVFQRFNHKPKLHAVVTEWILRCIGRTRARVKRSPCEKKQLLKASLPDSL